VIVAIACLVFASLAFAWYALAARSAAEARTSQAQRLLYIGLGRTLMEAAVSYEQAPSPDRDFLRSFFSAVIPSDQARVLETLAPPNSHEDDALQELAMALESLRILNLTVTQSGATQDDLTRRHDGQFYAELGRQFLRPMGGTLYDLYFSPQEGETQREKIWEALGELARRMREELSSYNSERSKTGEPPPSPPGQRGGG